MRVRWSARASNDLRSIGRYIARDKPGAARRFVQTLRERAQSLKQFPNKGRIVAMRASKDVREIIHGDYRILYRIKKDHIEIAAVFHAAKLLDLDIESDD